VNDCTPATGKSRHKVGRKDAATKNFIERGRLD
jgi:hypothetical protein